MKEVDPYRWLEDGTSASTRDWLSVQEHQWNHYRTQQPENTPFRQLLELAADCPQSSTPIQTEAGDFYLHRVRGQERPALQFRGQTGRTQTVFEPNVAPPHVETITGFQPNWAGSAVAYQVARLGREVGVLYLRSMVDGRVRCVSENVRYSSTAWSSDDAALFYVRHELIESGASRRRVVVVDVLTGQEMDLGHPDWPAEATYRLQTVPTCDTLLVAVRQPGDAQPEFWVVRSAAARDGQLREATVARGPNGALLTMQLTPDVGAIATHRRHDGALEVLVADRMVPSVPSEWRCLWRVPEDESICDLAATSINSEGGPSSHILVLTAKAGGRRTVRLIDQGGETRTIDTGNLEGQRVMPSTRSRAFVSMSDRATPPTVFQLDPDGTRLQAWLPGEAEPVKRAHQRRRLQTEVDARLVHFASHDGTSVPMWIYRRTWHGNLPLPTILYGYGAFGQSVENKYDPRILAWTQAGGQYAIPAVRGGGDLGPEWHRAGSGRNKPNSVADYLAAASWLINEGLTTANSLAAAGGSAGGLLAAAAVMHAPERFAAAHISAALLDMTRFHLTGEGRRWITEFGDPDDEADRQVLLSYSPYHHITRRAYPAMLFTAYAADDRVDPMHTRKMVAALNDANTSTTPIMLRWEPDSGHGARPMSHMTALFSEAYWFIGHHTGIIAGGAHDDEEH